MYGIYFKRSVTISIAHPIDFIRTIDLTINLIRNQNTFYEFNGF